MKVGFHCHASTAPNTDFFNRIGHFGGHRYRRASGAEPGVLQSGAFEDEVSANDGLWHAPVAPDVGTEQDPISVRFLPDTEERDG